MCLFTILFAAVGFLSPANRGSLMIAVLLTYVLMGSVAGKRLCFVGWAVERMRKKGKACMDAGGMDKWIHFSC